ncbi:MAG: CAP domain-containing protein [Candidatus Shapirobacteria bacterium]
MNKRSKKKLKNLFIPNRDNNFRPKFFETGPMLGFGILILAAFIFSINIPNILKSVASNSQLSAVLPSVLTELTNEERTNASLSALKENDLLDKAAAMKASDMATKGYFAHVSPEGKKPWNWVQDVGYKYQYAGENLAVNFKDSEDVTVAWMNSPTHKANIVKAEYTEIGTGVATGTYNGVKSIFVAQVFAKPYVALNSANVLDAVAPIKDPIRDFFNYLLYNNHDLTNKILIGFLIFVGLALILKVIIYIRIQHKGLILNGLGVCGFIVVLMLVNNYISDKKPTDLEYSSYEYSINQYGENVIKN